MVWWLLHKKRYWLRSGYIYYIEIKRERTLVLGEKVKDFNQTSYRNLFFNTLFFTYIERKLFYSSGLLFILKLISMTYCGDPVFFGALYRKRLQRVQLEPTTLGWMKHRKQMPFLWAATTTDIEQLLPHGALLIHERGFTFSANQQFWILHQNSRGKRLGCFFSPNCEAKKMLPPRKLHFFLW